MFQIDVLSRTPVYEQIVNQLERLVLGNILPPGCQLPSVRTLSVELAINPNTIQKAYAELERRGLSVSVPGKGSFVKEDLSLVRCLYQEEQKDRLHTLLTELRSYEFDRSMILSCVDQVFPPDSGDFLHPEPSAGRSATDLHSAPVVTGQSGRKE